MSEWKLVPVKPTTEMCTAATGEWHPDKHARFTRQYAAALAAAPQSPSVQQPAITSESATEVKEPAQQDTKETP